MLGIVYRADIGMCKKKMKKWEARHPITGIVLCTISGGIFISLVAGIVLEAIMMTI